MRIMNINRPFFVFYILVLYIFIQFTWWGYHLIELNEEIYFLKIAVAHSQELGEDVLQLSKSLESRKAMVLGEGFVFLLLLIIGALITRKAFLKEVDLSKQQKNFLMSVSHELKSPLASIKLNLQTLKKHDLDEAKSTHLLTASVKDTDRLVALVDNIIIATGIESGDFPLNQQRLNVSQIITDTVSSIGSRSKRSVLSDIDPDLYMTGDEQAVISIVSNLVENALKYSGTEAPVSVSLKQEDETICLSVADQGKGIAPGDEQKIFEKFYRVGNETTRKAKGTGLGLFITHHLTTKQNGTISVHRNDSKGSTFEVRFQIALA